jgi:hypothetical protein
MEINLLIVFKIISFALAFNFDVNFLQKYIRKVITLTGNGANVSEILGNPLAKLFHGVGGYF